MEGREGRGKVTVGNGNKAEKGVEKSDDKWKEKGGMGKKCEKEVMKGEKIRVNGGKSVNGTNAVKVEIEGRGGKERKGRLGAEIRGGV